MGIINIAGNLSFFLRILDSQENDGKPPSVQDFFFPFGEKLKEGILLHVGDGGCEGFGFVFGEVEFGLFDGFLFGVELLSGEDLCFGVVALFFELSGEFDIAEIHFILFGDVFVKVLIVGLELVEGVVVELAFVLVVVHVQLYKCNLIIK